MQTEKKVLAMYDVRGIQKYIFRTAKVKDAIGASAIVEDIIMDALKDAVKKKSHTYSLDWCNEDGYFPYEEKDVDIQVLFIGGGNAYVLYKTKEICVGINKLMSNYILRNTYSLQLAVAMIEKGDNYSDDYSKLQKKLIKVKAKMRMSKPLGSLPVMKTEVKTGYPLGLKTDQQNGNRQISQETYLKQKKSEKQQINTNREERIFDNLINNKGTDSNLAVVHIDGNSMGLRIRSIIQDINDYEEAINTMRNISYNINYSYKRVFDQMKSTFESNHQKDYIIRKIVVAGDDITYVCNAQIALATVEFFAKYISECTMNGKKDADSIRDYSFSICAGVTFIHSHFPFYVGYQVAEELCGNAKDRAKDSAFADKNRVGNFVDFHICKNVQAQNLEQMRADEYETSSGEQLLIRPYYISVKNESIELAKNNDKLCAWNNFKEYCAYFQKEKMIPRSFAKEIRNTYPLGEARMSQLQSFLQSRNHAMPDGTFNMYSDTENVALWYDAVEMLDYYMPLEELIRKENADE